MRRMKAIYLVIVLAILWIGGGVAGWMLLLDPEKKACSQAEKDWESAVSAMSTALSDARAAQDSYPISAKKILDSHKQFVAIQNTMPDIYNMKAAYTGKDKAGLDYLYKMMTTDRPGQMNKLVRELTLWTKKYKLNPSPTYKFTGTLGYEDTLTSVKFVMVPFAKQTFRAYGLSDLIAQVRARYGYGNCPLLITGPEIRLGPADTPAARRTRPGALPSAAGRPSVAPLSPGPAGRAPMPPRPTGAPTGAGRGSAIPATGEMQMIGQAAVPRPPGGAPVPPVPGAVRTPAGAPTAPGRLPGAVARPGIAGAAAASAEPTGTGIGTFTITVDQNDSRHTPSRPALLMEYNACGLFMTRGWDPLAESLKEMDMQQFLDQMNLYISAPPQAPGPRKPSNPFPLIFGIFGGRDVEK